MQIWWSDVSLFGSFWIFCHPHWTPLLILRRCFVGSTASQSRNTQPCTKSLPTLTRVCLRMGSFHTPFDHKVWPLDHWIDVVPHLTHHQIWPFESEKKNRWSTKRNPVFFEVNILETTPCLLYLADAAAMFGGVLASTWAGQGPKFAQEWIHPKGIHPTFIQRGFDQQIYIGIIRLSLIIMISFMRIWGSRFLRFMGTSVDGWWEMSMYDWLYDYQLFSWEGSLESKWSLTSVCNSHGIMGLE